MGRSSGNALVLLTMILKILKADKLKFIKCKSLMRALFYYSFGPTPRVANLPDPVVPRDGVVVEVKASGICRSDWHGWQGHDADIRTLPHIPGHEFAGVI